jgi:hypothetical protein
MRVRVIDFDGSIPAQERVLRHFQPDVYDLRSWGPRLRMACRWASFYRLERRLDRLIGSRERLDPWINLLGSGDFHHVSLAMLRRMRRPFNLLVLDKHPGWFGGHPLLHSTTWLHHAAKLPNVRRIFHVGGETNFDNRFRWLAPKSLLRNGKIVVLPASRVFRNGYWSSVPHQSLRPRPGTLVEQDRLEELLWAHLNELDGVPLYVSLDKDVLWMPESITNWDAGVLDLSEVQEVLQFFLKASGNDLLGMDLVGDWSPVETNSAFRLLLHRLHHPKQFVDAEQARLCNERTNLMLLKFLTHEPAAQSRAPRSRLKSV